VRANTQTVSIEAPWQRVYDFLSNPEHLPRWAIGFAKSVRADSDGWLVDTGQAEIPVRIIADPDHGTVDFHMEPAPGATSVAFSRVMPNGEGAEYAFTQFQAPGMTDEMFVGTVKALTHELVTLKALLEVECPL
jgi:uncharacterized protein YndB with AHSA1/START domain